MLECVDWFNNCRLLEPIGHISPAKAEQRYYAMLDDQTMAAQLTPTGLRQSRSGSLRPNRPQLTIPPSGRINQLAHCLSA